MFYVLGNICFFPRVIYEDCDHSLVYTVNFKESVTGLSAYFSLLLINLTSLGTLSNIFPRPSLF